MTTAHQARRRDRQSLFVLASAILHVLLIGLLMLFPPVRQAVFGEKPKTPDTEIRVEGERLAEIVEQIRDVNQEELLKDVMELEAMHQQMEQIKQAKFEEFEPFAEQQALEAPDRAAEEMDETIQAQQEALDALKRAEQDEASRDEMMSEARRRQADAEAAQTETAARLDVATPELTQTKAKQVEAIDAQKKASDAAKAAAEARGAAESAAKTAENQARDLAKLEKELANAREKAEKSQAAAESKRQQAEQAVAKVEAAKAAVEAASDKAKSQAQRQATQAQKAADKATSDAQKADATAKKDADELAKRGAAAVQKKADAEAAVKAAEAAAKAVPEKIEAAVKAQAEAIEVQKSAKATLTDEAATEAAQDSPKTAESVPTPPFSDPFQMPLAELYNHAKDLESSIADQLQTVRAAELAMLTDVTLEQAKANTDVPRTQRPEVDAALLSKSITAASEFKAQAEELETVRREAKSMANAAANMLNSAAALVRKSEEGTSVDLSQIQADAALAAAINKAAHEIEGGEVADLAALMKGGLETSAASTGPAKPGANTGEVTPKNGDGGQTGGSGVGSPLQTPSLDQIKAAVPARKFSSAPTDAPRTAGWVFIDSWYTIGPFDNPGRVNIHRKFPPESVIDLDAVYSGKRGQPIRWQHMQSHEPLVLPPNPEPYGIWYAYTELHFDQPADLWIAVGSDDRSDLWINDMKVWSSSDQLKSWHIGEGLRRVHFQQGRNRVLCRIENGHHGMGWSVAIYTAPVAAAP